MPHLSHPSWCNFPNNIRLKIKAQMNVCLRLKEVSSSGYCNMGWACG
jgi:hypothetical protein